MQPPVQATSLHHDHCTSRAPHGQDLKTRTKSKFEEQQQGRQKKREGSCFCCNSSCYLHWSEDSNGGWAKGKSMLLSVLPCLLLVFIKSEDLSILPQLSNCTSRICVHMLVSCTPINLSQTSLSIFNHQYISVEFFIESIAKNKLFLKKKCKVWSNQRRLHGLSCKNDLANCS